MDLDGERSMSIRPGLCCWQPHKNAQTEHVLRNAYNSYAHTHHTYMNAFYKVVSPSIHQSSMSLHIPTNYFSYGKIWCFSVHIDRPASDMCRFGSMGGFLKRWTRFDTPCLCLPQIMHSSMHTSLWLWYDMIVPLQCGGAAYVLQLWKVVASILLYTYGCWVSKYTSTDGYRPQKNFI